MFVGRKKELFVLTGLLNYRTSSYIAVYGRRRIGKTEIIRHFCTENNLLTIEITGKMDATSKNQLNAFVDSVRRDIAPSLVKTTLTNWQEAFILLRDTIKSLNLGDQKIVLFFDEVPWLDTRKSNFFNELSHFYNSFVSRTDNIIMIVCGSAASYMIDKFVRDRGAQHSRLTHILPMEAFQVSTAKQMIDSLGCHYSLGTAIDLYMVFGGVAKYLTYLSSSKTPQQNIQDIVFGPMAMMKQEYEDLFKSLFTEYQAHYKIMDLLSSKWSGYSKADIARLLNMSQPGITRPLMELEKSGFVKALPMFGHSVRDVVYRASDPFSFFHNKWMKGISKNALSQIDFLQLYNTQSYKSWCGFAFENVCFMHINEIKMALGISGIPTKSHYWDHKPVDANDIGAQIDMLLEHDNKSNNIDIIECKHHDGVYAIDKKYRDDLKRKIMVFNNRTGGRYNIRLILITVYGVARNQYYNELGCVDLKASDIFI
jgi:uncharacterized protein